MFVFCFLFFVVVVSQIVVLLILINVFLAILTDAYTLVRMQDEQSGDLVRRMAWAWLIGFVANKLTFSYLQRDNPPLSE